VTPPERVVQTFEWDGMPGLLQPGLEGGLNQSSEALDTLLATRR
jgi:hypothetical protein